MSKTIAEINAKIQDGTVRVVRADEMTRIVLDVGPERAAADIDVVTTGTFGAMCSSGVWLNFGHADPPIKMTRVWLNDVEAYAGVAAVDAYLGATQPSALLGIRYGGAHVIEDLLRGKPVVLRAVSYGTDCYPRKAIVTSLTLDDLNFAVMSNPRNAYQRYNAAANSGGRTLRTYMGTLLPRAANVSFSGAGELSPLMNDPDLETIGVGTRIFLGGAPGIITGAGTQHAPEARFSTLMVQGDLKAMSPEFVRAAAFPGYGCSLYLGIGVPIPILDAETARKAGIADADIETDILDYSVPSRNRPVLRRTNYAELKSGTVEIEGRPARTAPLSSFAKAREVAETLKAWIKAGSFTLTEPVERLPRTGRPKGLDERPLPPALGDPTADPPNGPGAPSAVAPGTSPLTLDADLCVQCGHCLALCPESVFRRAEDWRIEARVEDCRSCGVCVGACPVGALRLAEARP
jgi:uncharacterized protein (DUF39 family)/ferredoxin